MEEEGITGKADILLPARARLFPAGVLLTG